MARYKRELLTVLILLFFLSVPGLYIEAAQQVQVIPISPQAEPLSPPPLTLPQQESAGKAVKPAPIEVPAPAADKPSEFEQYVSGTMSDSVSSNIRQFGYDLFNRAPSSFAPVEDVPVGPDYVIGPGDEIRVSIWGSIDGQWTTVVDRDGTISLPKLGRLGITGLTFSEVKTVLHKELSKYYTGFEMNVSLGSLRTIRVYVVGNASRPGSYTISSLSTLLNALFQVGGPSKTGTMRDIRVERSGKTVARFDLYELLLRGDKTRDIRLMPEDVIFIPPVGALVGIAGSVNNPAIYEIKDEKTVSELVQMAGGLSAVAFKGRVQIERIIDSRSQVVFEADLASMGNQSLAIQSGDMLKVFQVVQDRKVVRLTGAVNRSGDYGFTEGMRVRELISMAGGLKHYAYSREAELTRVSVSQAGPKTEKIMIDLEKAMAGDEAGNIALKEDDYLFVRAVPEWRLYRTASITGEVLFPGTFTIEKGERLSSLLERAGGYTDRAYLRGTVFIREQVRQMQQKGLEEMLSRMQRELMSEQSTQIASSASAEELNAKRAELEAKQRFIQALRDLKATGRMTVKLAHLRLLKGSEYDLELEDGDRISIPTKSSVVSVMGSVMSMGSHIYHENNSYRNYIAMSGGYTRYADTDNIYVLKVDGSARKVSTGLFNWSEPRARWETAGFSEDGREIEPGDTIVVPEKLERVAWMREVKDITQILMQMAVTAGVVIELLDED